MTLCGPLSGVQICVSIGVSKLYSVLSVLLILNDHYPKNEWYTSSAWHSFISILLKMQFHHPQEKNYRLRNKKKKYNFLGSDFIFHSPVYWFFFPPKTSVSPVFCECECVGFSLKHHSLRLLSFSLSLLITSSTLFILLSIKHTYTSDTRHPPLLSVLQGVLILREHSKQKRQLSSDIYIHTALSPRSPCNICQYFLLYKKVSVQYLRGTLMKCMKILTYCLSWSQVGGWMVHCMGMN